MQTGVRPYFSIQPCHCFRNSAEMFGYPGIIWSGMISTPGMSSFWVVAMMSSRVIFRRKYSSWKL